MQKENYPAAIMGLSIIISAIFFGLFYYYAQSNSAAKDILAVTGSAKTHVVSDSAKLVINISRTVSPDQLSFGYTSIASDLSLVEAFLKKENTDSKQITESPVSMNQLYNNKGEQNDYQLSQTITIQSSDVNKITDVSKKVPSLASQGVFASIQSLEYYYSKLPDLRVSLLSDAVKDAKARAEKIAQGTGRKIGNVQSASNGVVQVLPPNSVDISDYGSYDTSSIQKDVMVTIKASFRLQ